MATRSGFFNSINGDRKYLAKHFAEYFATFIGNGVFPTPSNGLQVYAGTNMTVVIKAGKAWIDGYDFINDSDYNLTIAQADGVLNRIDRIVVRLDHVTRKVDFALKKGTLASSPVAPTLQRDAEAYELGIADVYVTRGATAITQTYITDLRLNSTYCGIVAGVVKQIDTSSVFNQYQDWFNMYSVTKAAEFADWQEATKDAVDAWIANEQIDFNTWLSQQDVRADNWFNTNDTRFNTWFEEVQGILNGNAIGNLQSMLSEHLSAQLPHQWTDSVTGKTYKIGFGIENGKPILATEEVV